MGQLTTNPVDPNGAREDPACAPSARTPRPATSRIANTSRSHRSPPYPEPTWMSGDRAHHTHRKEQSAPPERFRGLRRFRLAPAQDDENGFLRKTTKVRGDGPAVTPGPPRLRDSPHAQRRDGPRPRPGDVPSRLPDVRQLPSGNQLQGVAVYDLVLDIRQPISQGAAGAEDGAP